MCVGNKKIRYSLFYYKNILYKNIEAENGSKIKNILRIFQAQLFILYTNIAIWRQTVAAITQNRQKLKSRSAYLL